LDFTPYKGAHLATFRPCAVGTHAWFGMKKRCAVDTMRASSCPASKGDALEMKVRAAVLEDAPAMGRVMVEAWLAAHRGQMPDSAWVKRVDEWTPDVSARAWARLLSGRDGGDHARIVLLVAEADAGDLRGLVLGTEVEDDESGATAQIDALYVRPDTQGQGVGRWLLREATRGLASLGFSKLHVGVLSANLAARAFYEAMGGHEISERTYDEEGHLLPGTVYGWPDLNALIGDFGERP
jgi:ribosomal protein S18 acetylase RimI-like enzyme